MVRKKAGREIGGKGSEVGMDGVREKETIKAGGTASSSAMVKMGRWGRKARSGSAVAEGL